MHLQYYIYDVHLSARRSFALLLIYIRFIVDIALKVLVWKISRIILFENQSIFQLWQRNDGDTNDKYFYILLCCRTDDIRANATGSENCTRSTIRLGDCHWTLTMILVLFHNPWRKGFVWSTQIHNCTTTKRLLVIYVSLLVIMPLGVLHLTMIEQFQVLSRKSSTACTNSSSRCHDQRSEGRDCCSKSYQLDTITL